MAKNGRKEQASGPEAGGFLDRSPAHLLHRALQRANDIHVEAMGAGGLTQRQFAVLEAVAAGEGRTQADLVRATGVDRSTLADLAARMTAKGLLVRERSTLDGRANAVALSDEGRAVLAAARPCMVAADRRILSALPGGRRERFLDLLAILADDSDEAAQAKAERKAAKLARRADKEKAKAAKAGKPGKNRKNKPRPAAGASAA